MEPPKEVGYVMAQGDDGRKYGPLHSKEIRDGIVPDEWGMLPRSYLMVIHELHHDAAGAIMFWNCGVGRMAHPAFEDVEDEDSDEFPVTKDTSVSQVPDEDDEDEEDEDEADDKASAEVDEDDNDVSMEDVWDGEDDDDVLMEDFSDDWGDGWVQVLPIDEYWFWVMELDGVACSSMQDRRIHFWWGR
jgi:hypothetical protein